MNKSTKLIISALGLGALGYFLYKKGLFGKNADAALNINTIDKNIQEKVDETNKKIETPSTLKNPPVCESGYKLQMVDVNCNGQDCEVHCVPIPAVPDWKQEIITNPAPTPTPVVDVDPIIKSPIFKEVPENPIIFYPYTDIPVEVVVNPYVGVPQSPFVPVSDNSFKEPVLVYQVDPYEGLNTNYGKEAVNKELNQLLYA